MASKETTVLDLSDSDTTTSSPKYCDFPIIGGCVKEMGCKGRTSSHGGGGPYTKPWN